jgi:hypothetical protein
MNTDEHGWKTKKWRVIFRAQFERGFGVPKKSRGGLYLPLPCRFVSKFTSPWPSLKHQPEAGGVAK